MLASLAGCTTVDVRRVDAQQHDLKLVCIEEHTVYPGSDLLTVIEDGFHRHGIKTMVYSAKAPDSCEYTLRYAEYRGWDFTQFLKRVELSLRLKDKTIASATYNHSGGLALNKYASTQEKVNPVIDELLGEFSRE